MTLLSPRASEERVFKAWHRRFLMISAAGSISSSYYQKNENFEECLRGSQTKQCSSIILVCVTLSLTALIVWFFRMQSLPLWNFPFGWINTKEVGTWNYPPQKCLSAQAVVSAQCSRLCGEWAIPWMFRLSECPGSRNVPSALSPGHAEASREGART